MFITLNLHPLTQRTVGSGGFEPPKSKDSGFTVRPIWPLWKLPLFVQILSRRRESNPRPTDYKSVALPTELLRLLGKSIQSPGPLSQAWYRATNLMCIDKNFPKQAVSPIFWEGKGKRNCLIPKFCKLFFLMPG